MKLKAMIFAAGEGTRLRPLTLSMPKALVEVGGEPVLARAIRAVVAAGACEVVVNVHHLADMVEEYLQHTDFGVEVRVSDERRLLLDTGGGLLAAEPLLDDADAIMLHNADIVTDLDLSAMPCDGDATLLTSRRQTSRSLLFEGGRLCGWRDNRTGRTLGNPAGEERAFNGVHLVRSTIFGALHRYAAEAGEVFSLTPFYVAQAQKLDIRGWMPGRDYRWFDIGNLQKLEAARHAFE